MCAILDANQFGNFKQQDNGDMRPVKDWLIKNRGRLVYSAYGAYAKEWQDTWGEDKNLSPMMFEYRSANKLVKAERADIEQSEQVISEQVAAGKISIQSDDEHILALAYASGAKLLISSDKNLHKDFKTIIKGKVYQNHKHKNLLKPDTCP